jgi:hypothetical protein
MEGINISAAGAPRYSFVRCVRLEPPNSPPRGWGNRYLHPGFVFLVTQCKLPSYSLTHRVNYSYVMCISGSTATVS